MWPALQYALQQEFPLDHWPEPASGKPAHILVLANSWKMLKSIRQRIPSSNSESPAETITYQSLRTFLHHHFAKLSRTKPRFVGYLTFVIWCEEIAMLFPNTAKTKEKKSQPKPKALGDTLLDASTHLLPEEMYPDLYEELKQLALSKTHASERSTIKKKNSNFKIAAPKIKATIESLLIKYQAWLEAENLFDFMLADLSQYEFSPTPPHNRFQYTDLVLYGEEIFLSRLIPYLKKTAHIQAAQTLFENSPFTQKITREHFFNPEFIQLLFRSATNLDFLHDIFYRDISLTIETLEALHESPGVFISFIAFIFGSKSNEDETVFTKITRSNDQLLMRLSTIFFDLDYTKQCLNEHYMVVMIMIEELDLECPKQTRLLKTLLTSINAEIKKTIQLTLERYQNSDKSSETFLNKYETMLEYLEKKQGELTTTPEHQEISTLIFRFVYLFIEECLQQKQHSITLYRMSMQIFEEIGVKNEAELSAVMGMLRIMHNNYLMKNNLLTDHALRANNAWNASAWKRIENIWDRLRSIYEAMINLCANANAGFEGGSKIAIDAYGLFKTHLNQFPIASRPGEYLPYGNLYIKVLEVFKTELAFSQKNNPLSLDTFFKRILAFLEKFPAHEKWPNICQLRIFYIQLSIFISWLKREVENKPLLISQDILSNEWKSFLQKINKNESALPEIKALVGVAITLLSSPMNELNTEFIVTLESALSPDLKQNSASFFHISPPTPSDSLKEALGLTHKNH